MERIISFHHDTSLTEALDEGSEKTVEMTSGIITEGILMTLSGNSRIVTINCSFNVNVAGSVARRKYICQIYIYTCQQGIFGYT